MSSLTPTLEFKLELGLQSHFHNPLAFQVKQGTCLGLNLHLDTNLSSSFELLPLPLPTCCPGSKTSLVKVALPQVVRLTSVEHASTVTTHTHTHTHTPSPPSPMCGKFHLFYWFSSLGASLIKNWQVYDSITECGSMLRT